MVGNGVQDLGHIIGNPLIQDRIAVRIGWMCGARVFKELTIIDRCVPIHLVRPYYDTVFLRSVYIQFGHAVVFLCGEVEIQKCISCDPRGIFIIGNEIGPNLPI